MTSKRIISSLIPAASQSRPSITRTGHHETRASSGDLLLGQALNSLLQLARRVRGQREEGGGPRIGFAGPPMDSPMKWVKEAGKIFLP